MPETHKWLRNLPIGDISKTSVRSARSGQVMTYSQVAHLAKTRAGTCLVRIIRSH
jgi:alkylated DNA nucleotide flippase Atl1